MSILVLTRELCNRVLRADVSVIRMQFILPVASEYVDRHCTVLTICCLIVVLIFFFEQ